MNKYAYDYEMFKRQPAISTFFGPGEMGMGVLLWIL